MNRLRVEFEGDRASFLPGERVKGTASWVLIEPPEEIELRLFYYTVGKGDQDVGIAQRLAFSPSQEGESPFELELPTKPYSFSGKLISIIWGVELVAEPSVLTERLEIVIGPGKQEVRVDRNDSDHSGSDASSG